MCFTHTVFQAYEESYSRVKYVVDGRVHKDSMTYTRLVVTAGVLPPNQFNFSRAVSPVSRPYKQGRGKHRHTNEEAHCAHHQDSIDATQDLEPLSTVEWLPSAVPEKRRCMKE